MSAKKQEFTEKEKNINKTGPHPKEEREQRSKSRWHNGFPTLGFHHLRSEMVPAYSSKNEHGRQQLLKPTQVWQSWQAPRSQCSSATEEASAADSQRKVPPGNDQKKKILHTTATLKYEDQSQALSVAVLKVSLYGGLRSMSLSF